METGTQRRSASLMRRAAGVVVLSMVAVASCGTDGAPLDRAIAVAEDDGAFGNGPEAGESLARIAQHLEDARRSCEPEVRCRALAAASGYAQVLAVQVLRCTAPGRFEARTAIADLLRRIDELDAAATAAPEPAPLPDCT